MTVLDRVDSSQGDRGGWGEATEASLCISHLRTGVSLVRFIVCPLWIAQSLLQRGELSSRLIEKARINGHFSGDSWHDPRFRDCSGNSAPLL